MKYLFLDCFLFLSPKTLASALCDMTKNKEKLKKLCASLKNSHITFSEEKRCGMEAAYISLDYELQTEEITQKNLYALAEKLNVSENTKEKLLKYISYASEAKSIEPDKALFEAKSATDSLIFTAYALEIIKELKTEAIYVSKVPIPSPDISTQAMSQKISNALYILKKYGISPSHTPIDAPSLSEEWAALTAVLEPIQKSSKPGNIISTGYGAGEDNIDDMPNILRAVYGEDREDDILFEAEEALKLNFDFAD